MMDIAKLLRRIGNGSSPAGIDEDEKSRLRAENARLRAAVEAASEALAAAPLWHIQHRVARNILLDVRDELAEAGDFDEQPVGSSRH
ncbi:hypothetical protein [Thauera sinica]|uniref:Uncharacterized protein n=1 Tax=Thauera sinica TaxID=2665146 RepID=A0ABW1ANJ0_9RHOO|nr:hypothetical protein [Thauera sp. K11]ATE61968.1 hypothetical protein CCZ27_20120 [Thauera sp. K11]